MQVKIKNFYIFILIFDFWILNFRLGAIGKSIKRLFAYRFEILFVCNLLGAPGAIWTPNRQLRKLMLYPVKLQAQKKS